ncbi:MAG: hypothetical protein R2715_24785 [Ilumatobacteraceae bacterium]
MNQVPRVQEGQKLVKGDVIADGPRPTRERARPGQEPPRGLMPWEGWLQLRGRHHLVRATLVKDDACCVDPSTSTVDAADTKLRPGRDHRDIPNLSDDILRDLDDRGIIRIGAEVGPNDVASAR